MLFHRMVLGDLQTNCYIAADENTGFACLFDAPAKADFILEYLKKKSLKLEYIFLTHGHFDHTLAVDELKRATGAKLCMHENDAKMLNDAHLNFSDEFNLTLPHMECDFFVSDGTCLPVPFGEIKVIHTPGHSNGSVCYLIGNILISGDTLFKRSVGHADGFGGNLDTETASIKNKLLALDDTICVYPGHGFSTTIGAERKENPFLI